MPILRILFVSVVLSMMLSPAFAGDGEAELIASIKAMLDCRNTAIGADRLSCFDKAVASLAIATGEPEAGAGTKDILSNHKPEDFKKVDPDDVFVAPGKFKGKPIELTNMRCFYADKNDYRCISANTTTGVLAVFVEDIAPAAAKTHIEDVCGSIKKLPTLACRATIHVIPDDFDHDILSGYQQRVVIRASILEIQSPQIGERR